MPRRKRNRKWLKWVILLVLVAVAGVVWYFVWDGYFREKPKEEVAKPAEVTEVVEKPAEILDAEITEEEKTEVAEKMEQYESVKTETSEYTGVVNYAAVSGDKLVIRVNIDQYVSGGTCRLSLRKDGAEVYSETAKVADVVSTATCEGFDVALSKIGANGELDIVVEVSAGGKSGVINGKVGI